MGSCRAASGRDKKGPSASTVVISVLLFHVPGAVKYFVEPHLGRVVVAADVSVGVHENELSGVGDVVEARRPLLTVADGHAKTLDEETPDRPEGSCEKCPAWGVGSDPARVPGQRRGGGRFRDRH